VCALIGLLGIGPIDLTSSAVADSIICTNGPGAGECSAPSAVAADGTEGLVYVADSGNARVEVFEADGTFLRAFGWGVDTGASALEVCTAASGCQAGLPGSGPGQFASLDAIAVDNDGFSAAVHSVYVLDRTNKRVLRFASSGSLLGGFAPTDLRAWPQLALAPGGLVLIGDSKELAGGSAENRIRSFDPDGTETAQCLIDTEGAGRLTAIAADSDGSVYAAYAASGGSIGGVRKYANDCSLISSIEQSFNSNALGVDALNGVYVADKTSTEGGGHTAIYGYDDAGDIFTVTYGNGTLIGEPISIAPYTDAAGDLFVVEGDGSNRVAHVALPDPGPVVVPDPALTKADPVGNVSAVLRSVINPEGKSAEFFFEFVDDATYKADQASDGDGFKHAKIAPTEELGPPELPQPPDDPLFRFAPASQTIGCGSATQALVAEGKCLSPSTVYHFRPAATNADVPAGEVRLGPEATFETRPPFEILGTFASGVSDDAATLQAEVDPEGIPMSGHFEYVEQGKFENNGFEEATSTPVIDFGSGSDPIIASVQLDALEPGTVYRYRVTVENFFASGEGEIGAIRTFLAAEDPKCPNAAVRLGPSAGLPDCRAYEMVSPVAKGGGEISVLTSPIRGAQAGLTQSAAQVPEEGEGLAYSSVRSFGDAVAAPYTSQYLANRDPQAGWSSHGISPSREGPLYYSIIGLDTQYKRFSEDLSAAWLRTDAEPILDSAGIEGFSNLYRRDNLSETYEAICPVMPPKTASEIYVPEPQGSSANEQLIVFRANDKLTGDASDKAGIYQLYGCADGTLRLVSVLPPAQGGKASGENSSAGTAINTQGDHRELSISNAVSEDGKYVYWTNSGTVGSGTGKIYLRKNPMGAGVPCSSEVARCTVPVSETVGVPGATEPAQFWTAAADGTKAIYRFTSGPLAGSLYEYDVEDEASTLIAKGVIGVSGWSKDASRIYFVSTNDLGDGGEAGAPNLYLREASDGSVRLVATLQANDRDCVYVSQTPFRRCSRTTADGSRFLFVSRDQLTEYDNRDAANGIADTEVYIYHADEGGGELFCVSCNPSGGRPEGQAVPSEGTTALSWVAGRIPDQRDGFYASRTLSADGRRLYFESFDRLALEDTNDALDVYEWEEAGKGKCEISSHRYSESAKGCIALISSGQSSSDSHFADASADGEDVFFTTAESLFPTDPGLVDLYDARVGGGFLPPPAPTKPCDEPEGAVCQSEAESPGLEAPALPSGDKPLSPSPDCGALARKAKKLAGRAAKARRSGKRQQAVKLVKEAKNLRSKVKRCHGKAGAGK